MKGEGEQGNGRRGGRGAAGKGREGCSEAATYEQRLPFRAFAFFSDVQDAVGRFRGFSTMAVGAIDGMVV